MQHKYDLKKNSVTSILKIEFKLKNDGTMYY